MAWKFNPFTGNFDQTAGDNFSYDVIDYTVIIPEGQQMIVLGMITINDILDMQGMLVLI